MILRTVKLKHHYKFTKMWHQLVTKLFIYSIYSPQVTKLVSFYLHWCMLLLGTCSFLLSIFFFQISLASPSQMICISAGIINSCVGRLFHVINNQQHPNFNIFLYNCPISLKKLANTIIQYDIVLPSLWWLKWIFA